MILVMIGLIVVDNPSALWFDCMIQDSGWIDCVEKTDRQTGSNRMRTTWWNMTVGPCRRKHPKGADRNPGVGTLHAQHEQHTEPCFKALILLLRIEKWNRQCPVSSIPYPYANSEKLRVGPHQICPGPESSDPCIFRSCTYVWLLLVAASQIISGETHKLTYKSHFFVKVSYINYRSNHMHLIYTIIFAGSLDIPWTINEASPLLITGSPNTGSQANPAAGRATKRGPRKTAKNQGLQKP